MSSQKPKSVFFSAADAFAPYRGALDRFDIIEIADPRQLMNSLIDNRAALLVIDGGHEDWRALTLAVKNSAATRRVPLCLVSDVAERRALAIVCGADLTLGWAEFGREMGGAIADLARAPDAETRARLACECAAELPALAAAGIKQFNRGEYYQQHDLFEALWMETAGPVRDLYRGILQVGVAYYQIERGNFRGALKMLQRSAQWLHGLPDVCQGVDVSRLRRDSYAARAELQRLGAGRLDELDRSLLKPVRRVSPQSPKR